MNLDANDQLRDGTLPHDPFSGAEPMNDAASDRESPRSENPGKQKKAKATVAKPVSPADVVERWQTEGPLLRVRTGIEPLDALCRGGLSFPWRMIIVGAPSAGKTALAAIIAHSMASAGAQICVGVLAVDEEPDDVAVRLAQMAGFSIDDAEQRDPNVLSSMRRELDELPIRLYDADHSIELAVEDLAAWAKQTGCRPMLVIDSLQTCSSSDALKADTPRLIVEANVAAMRRAATQFKMLVIATSEANRNSYRRADAAEESNDLAAGAESRAIEFGAQTQLMVRTPKDDPNTIHVRVAKNRRADRGEFWLGFNRQSHSVRECPAPSECPEQIAERTEHERRKNRKSVERDAKMIAHAALRHPNSSGRALAARVRANGEKMGQVRFDAAMTLLADGCAGFRLVDRNAGIKQAQAWCAEKIEES